MNRMLFSALAVLLAFIGPQRAEAEKVYRIGALVLADRFVPAFEGFKKKMTELGYREGENIRYDFQNARGNRKALKGLADKLVQNEPDLIVTSSTTATVPVAKATRGTDIPVVFLSAGNPKKVVKSYASSGNNLTGISTSSNDLIEKRLELLTELVPWARRVIVLDTTESVSYKVVRLRTREAAKKFGVELTEFRARNAQELMGKLSTLTRRLGDAVFLPPNLGVINLAREISEQAIREKLPTIGPNIVTVKRGALAAYSSDYFALGQQGAMLVDKVLNGARPMDLPIEQPLKLKLVINLKTAKAIGLKIPRGLLIRADEAIE